MIFDTDIFIWVQRGNEKAARLMEKTEHRYLSIQTYMELLQGAKDKTQHKYVKNFITAACVMTCARTWFDESTVVESEKKGLFSL